MQGIQGAGFEYCTPIQGASLPHTLRGHDMVGKAQTGTGKTAAFLVSIINDLIKHPIEDERYIGEARALILAPTRELAVLVSLPLSPQRQRRRQHYLHPQPRRQ